MTTVSPSVTLQASNMAELEERFKGFLKLVGVHDGFIQLEGSFKEYRNEESELYFLKSHNNHSGTIVLDELRQPIAFSSKVLNDVTGEFENVDLVPVGKFFATFTTRKGDKTATIIRMSV